MIFINQLINENLRLIPKIYTAKQKLIQKIEEHRRVFSLEDLLEELGGDRQKLVLEKEDLRRYFASKKLDNEDFWEFFFFFNSQNDYYLTIKK